VEQPPRGGVAVRCGFLCRGHFPGVEAHQIVELVAVWASLFQQVGVGQIVKEPPCPGRAGHGECRCRRAADAGSRVQGKQPEQARGLRRQGTVRPRQDGPDRSHFFVRCEHIQPVVFNREPAGELGQAEMGTGGDAFGRDPQS
jgi:hypothetical protein